MTRLERMEAYPLERQWRIYLYGQQDIHPPDLALAELIAKQGKTAADYVLEQLSVTKSDSDHISSLWLFQVMRRRGYFNICGNPDYLNRMRAHEFRIQRKVTRDYYRERLNEMCPA